MYVYNKDTGTLHIQGYCTHSSIRSNNLLIFETEKEARDRSGEKIHMCKICQKKREKKLKER